MRELAEILGIIVGAIIAVFVVVWVVSVPFAIVGWAVYFVGNTFGIGAEVTWWGSAALGFALIIVIGLLRMLMFR